MSGDGGRSAVFLAEMGVGPLWRRRQGAAPAVIADMVSVVNEADEVDEVYEAEAVDEAAPVAAAVAAAPEAAGRAPLSSAPSAPSIPDDASTAWFDDAPAPAAAPAVSDEAITAMDWAELKAAAARCTRCALSRSRKRVVFGRGDEAASWMMLGAGPNRADEKEGRAVAGDAGALLDNMLLALGLAGERDVYVTNLLKCRPQGPDGAERAPLPEEVQACRPYLDRELALTRAKTIVTLGQPALKGLFGNAGPKARGAVHRLGAAAVVATYHPDDLLRQGEAKARAWADLCLARSARDEGDAADGHAG